jgi:Fe2+ transport system protein B
MPVLSNVIIKTAARVEWYIKEAVPLFMLGALILFLLDYFALLPLLIQATETGDYRAGWGCLLRLPRLSCLASCAAILPRPVCLPCNLMVC